MLVDSGDTAFIIVSAALVFFMVPGLAFFYGGLVRKKNLLNIMACSFVMIGVVSLLWVICGYSLAFGSDHGHLIGGVAFFGMHNVGVAPNPNYASGVPQAVFLLFQMMFAIITPAIISGAMAERVKFGVFIAFGVIWSLVVYVPIAHWVWGVGGWLKNLGVLDFAGGDVVHVAAGVSAFVAALVLGKRRAFGRSPIIPHNIPFVALGAAILWFGWMGFNGGSALSANGIAVSAIVCTHLSACAAMLVWMAIEWKLTGKPSLLGALTGAVVGLSAATAGAGYVAPMWGILIGAIGSGLSYIVIYKVKSRFLYDDALDVFACHGVGGAWGIVGVGLFGSKAVNAGGNNGLFYGNPRQLMVQVLSMLVVGVFCAVMTFVILKVIAWVTPLRVSEQDEYDGLDSSQHDEEAYPRDDAFFHGVLVREGAYEED
ncbi:MAG: ammonium transporter [Propionibacteriaceae bacterium]|nr:ammonium transporter [Propionibacteriaceae bacterium]